MAMDRAGEFIQLFNQLVDHLRNSLGVDRGVSYPQMINLASRRDPIVRRNAIRLREYGELRNAIVHHMTYPEEVIAEPSEAAVKRFRQIVENITAPKLLLPTFRKAVRCFSPEDRLLDALAVMRDNDYAQVVVRDGGILTVLTSRGMSRWLEKQVNGGVVDIKDVKIRAALSLEGQDPCLIMAGSRTVDEAQQAFVDSLIRKKRRIFAIVVTENGKPEEEPLGIVTPGDLLGVVET